MSDFLLTTRRRAPGALASVLEAYLSPVTVACEERHGEWGSLAVARSAHDREVVTEDERFLSVLIGEPIVHLPAGSSGPARGGARREAVHGLLRTGSSSGWDERLDGPYAALGIRKEGGEGIVVSDLAGFLSLFFAQSAEGLVLGTHVECVARAAGRGHDVDPVSAVDLVANLTCTFP